jgi:hypothetical protein
MKRRDFITLLSGAAAVLSGATGTISRFPDLRC